MNTSQKLAFNPPDVVTNVHVSNRSAFVENDPENSTRVDFGGFRAILSKLEAKFENDEQVHLFQHIDKDGDRFITKEEFLQYFDVAFPEIVWISYGLSDCKKKNPLLLQTELPEALRLYGIYGFSQTDAEKLVRRFVENPGDTVPFEAFCKMISPGAIFMSRLHLVPVEERATWNEIVRAINAIFGVFVVGLFSYFPKPTSLPVLNSNLTFPLVFSPKKTTMEYQFDGLVVLLLVAWACLFVVSLRLRGTETWGRIFDCLTLVCALASVCSLLKYINPIMACIPLVGFVAVTYYLFVSFDLVSTRAWTRLRVALHMGPRRE